MKVSRRFRDFKSLDHHNWRLCHAINYLFLAVELLLLQIIKITREPLSIYIVIRYATTVPLNIFKHF